MSPNEPQLLDLQFQGVPGVIGSYLLASNGDLGLVETGPTTTLPRLLACLEPHGGLDGLTAIVVTHIHLDHSGAVGQILRMSPRVRCYVHSAGLPHLVEPSRLLRSAGRIYGDQMETLWGEVIGAPEDRVIAVDDGDEIEIGGTRLEVVYTPGHASHHIALFDPFSKRLFTGDAAGVRLPGFLQVRAPTPPPDLDPVRWHQSVDRMRDLNPASLNLTHYGPFSGDLGRHFDDLLGRLDRWIEIVRAGKDAGTAPDAITESLARDDDAEIQREGGDGVTLRRYDLALPWRMTVDGILHYLNRT